MLARVRILTPVAATLLALGTAIGTVAVAGPAAANPGGVPAIPLNTEQETTGSDTGASGFFSYTIQGSQLCYTLEVRGLSLPAVAAHIHKAPRHVAGPIVIPFTAVPSAYFFWPRKPRFSSGGLASTVPSARLRTLAGESVQIAAESAK